MFSSKMYPFPYTKNKIKNFIVVVTLLNFSYTFRFSFFPAFQYLSYISCYVKNFYIFYVDHIFLVILYNNWKRIEKESIDKFKF